MTPTAQLSLATDANAKDASGSYVLKEPPSLEFQIALKVFSRIAAVIELLGAERFVPGDPLIEFLARVRQGKQISDPVWKASETTFAKDRRPGADPELGPRRAGQKFLKGHGRALHWEPLARWITERARRDARALEAPLVSCKPPTSARPSSPRTRKRTPGC